MRKTSQDGGDSTSITSGKDSEPKKPGAILKTKRNSVKRKVQGFSHESDEAVIEPLLQKDKEKIETSTQSAKFCLLSKTKTDSINAKDDREKLIKDEKTLKTSFPDTRNISDTVIHMPSSSSTTAPLHNHMNTNVFSNHDTFKGLITPKTQILVEIDGSKSGYCPSPLIFTTAKIHTDIKTKQMEPLQVTPAPILSTIEVSVLKGTSFNNGGETSGVVSSKINTERANTSKTNTNSSEKDVKSKSAPSFDNKVSLNKVVDSKTLNPANKTTISPGTAPDYKDIMDTAATKDTKIVNHPTENKSTMNENRKGSDDRPSNFSLSQPSSTTEKNKTTASNDMNKSTVLPNSSNNTSANKNVACEINPTIKKDYAYTLEQRTNLNKNIRNIDLEASDNKSDAITKNKAVLNTFSSSKQLQRQKNALDKDDAATKSNVNSSSDKNNLPKSTAHNIQISDSVTTSNTKSSDITTSGTINQSSSFNTNTSVKPIITSSSSTVPMSKTSSANTKDVIISSATQPSVVSKNLPNNVIMAESVIKPTSATLSSKSKAIDELSNKSLPLASQPTTKVEVNKTPISSKSTENTTKITHVPTTTVKSTSTVTPSEKNITTGVSKSPPISDSSMKSAAAVTSIQSASLNKHANLKTNVSKSSSPNVVKAEPEITTVPKPYSVATKIVKTPLSASSTVKTESMATNDSKTSSTITNTEKNASATLGTAKTGTATTAIVKPLSTILNIVKNPVTSTSTINTEPVTTNVAKNSLTSSNIAKSEPTATSATKTKSVPTNAVKNPTTSTNIVKTVTGPATVSGAKTSSIATSAVKPPLTTSSSAVKTQSVSATVAKTSPVVTNTVKSSLQSVNKTSSLPVAANTAKPSVTKGNTISTNKATSAAASTTTVSTPVVGASSNSTSKSLGSNVKSEPKSTKLNNGNKS